MSWDWFSFFAGAPIWASLGVLVFTTLLGPSARSGARRLEARISRNRGDTEDTTVVSLGEYRIEKLRRPIAVGDRRRPGRS